jgi:hypothetical protein
MEEGAGAQRGPSARARRISVVNLWWGIGAVACPWMIAAAVHGGTVQGLLLLMAVGTAGMSAALLPQIREPEPGLAVGGRASAMAEAGTLAFFAAFFFLYLGVETVVGGWIPTYAHRFSGMTLAHASLTVSLYWTALLAGRLAGIGGTEERDGAGCFAAESGVSAARCGYADCAAFDDDRAGGGSGRGCGVRAGVSHWRVEDAGARARSPQYRLGVRDVFGRWRDVAVADRSGVDGVGIAADRVRGAVGGAGRDSGAGGGGESVAREAEDRLGHKASLRQPVKIQRERELAGASRYPGSQNRDPGQPRSIAATASRRSRRRSRRCRRRQGCRVRGP